MYHYLLGHLYKLNAEYTANDSAYFELLRASVQLGIQKCDDYFKSTDDTPAYLAAVILHPYYKWPFVERHIWKGRNDWIAAGKAAVQGLWERNYKNMGIEEIHHSPTPSKRVKHATGASQFITAGLESSNPHYITDEKLDEYQWYCEQPRLQTSATNDSDAFETFNPLQWWMDKRRQLPRLSTMALDLLAAPAMSDKAERIFSMLGNIVRPNRAGLKSSTVAAVGCLRNWDQEGVIDYVEGL